MRLWLLVVSMVGGSSAAAIAEPLSGDDVKRVERRGYRSPSLVLATPALRVVSAKQRGKPRLLVVTPDTIVDAGPQLPGALAVTAVTAPDVAGHGMTVLDVGYQTSRGTGTRVAAKLWLVRADGSLACRVEGSNSDNIGAACGSSGWTSATPKLSPDGNGGLFLDVRYMMSGNYSTPDKLRGGCLHRSPVRSSTSKRWHVPPRGTCKAAPAPRSTIGHDPDL